MGNSSSGRYRVVVCGQRSAAQRCLEYLHGRDDTTICAIVTLPNDWQADLIDWGVKHRVRVFVGNVNLYTDEIAALRPDLLVSIQHPHLFRPPILRVPSRGGVNLHFGLLPRYGGCYPIAWAILNGESTTGATLHWMTEAFDEGDILAQVEVPIAAEMTARELYDAVSVVAADLFADNYPALAAGVLPAWPQNPSQTLYYNKDSIDFQKDKYVRWHRSAAETVRQIRAFSFPPLQWPVTCLRLPDGIRIEVMVAQARLCPESSIGAGVAAPGRVVEANGDGTLLVAGDDGTMIEIGRLDGQEPRRFLRTLGVSPTEVTFE
jgi:methionyl-tRNA formyltransferase